MFTFICFVTQSTDEVQITNAADWCCQLKIHARNETQDIYQKWFSCRNSNFCWQNLNFETPQKFIYEISTKLRARDGFFYTKFTFFVTKYLQSLGIVSISNRIILCSLAAYSTWMRKCQFHSFFLFHNFYLLLCVQLCWGEPQSFFLVWYFSNDSMSSLYNIYSLILIARVNSSAWFMELIYSIRFK